MALLISMEKMKLSEPVLGFDNQGYRIGYGKGWYDKFLATQPRAVTIGLAYEISRVKEGLPKEPHDIPLKYIITEKTITKN